MIKGKLLPIVTCMFLVTLSACVNTEFFDDFEDGIVDPVYRFAVGDASSLVEGAPCEDFGNCLQRVSNAYFFLPDIPARRGCVSTPITPGVVIELDVLNVGVDATVELGVVDNIENIQDYFALKVDIDPSTQASQFTCYDEQERVPLEGSLSFPVNLSFLVDETGAVYGTFADEVSEIECPIHTPVESDTLAPAVVMWSLGEDDLAWVDNFHVVLE